jgi:hypothetical protein
VSDSIDAAPVGDPRDLPLHSADAESTPLGRTREPNRDHSAAVLIPLCQILATGRKAASDIYMKLPNGGLAFIDLRKVTDYCLSPDHEDGRHKAYLFQSILGLTLDDADTLIAALRQAATSGDAVLAKRDKYGQRYIIDFEFTGPGGRATIRSAWIIRRNESVPRLVTCFIL